MLRLLKVGVQVDPDRVLDEEFMHLKVDHERQRRIRSVEQSVRRANARIFTSDSDESSLLLASLVHLDATDRVMLVLRYYDDLPITEIAEIVKVSPAVVRLRLQRALRRMRSLLTEQRSV